MTNEERLDSIHSCVKKVYYALYGDKDNGGAIGMVERMQRVEQILDKNRINFWIISKIKYVLFTGAISALGGGLYKIFW